MEAVKTRDMSKAAFLAALDRHGIGRPGFMGYCEVPDASRGGFVGVSYLNANSDRWRDRLAYLIQVKQRLAKAKS
jgi:hypothetical protein